MEDLEPLTVGGLRQPLVERHEREGPRMVLGSHDRRPELQRIGGAQRMDTEQPKSPSGGRR